MNFKWYLTEKVRKNELKDIFNDDSILIGGEFEFFIDDLSGMGSSGSNIDELHSQWWDFKRELQDWKESIEEEQESLSNERSRLEDEKEELENKHWAIENKDEDEELDADEYDEEKIVKRIDEIDDRLSEIEDEEMEVFDRFPFPRASVELREFMDDMSGGEFNTNDIDPIEYLEMPDRVERELDRYEPTDEMVEVDEEAFLDEAKDFLDDNLVYNTKTGMHPKKGDDWWGVTVDSTVPPNEGGIELISPPLPMPDFIEAAEDILDFISAKGSTDSRCGLHVHMSIEGISLKDNLDVVKLFMFHDEEKVYQAFKERQFSTYASQVKNKIRDVNFDVDDLKKIINVSKLEKKLSTSKYYGMNLSDLEQDHIEFRYMGGADYEDKWDDIKEMVGNYGYELKLACDPNFKRQEYIKKLNRAINKQLEMNKYTYLTVMILQYIRDEMAFNFGKMSFIADFDKKIHLKILHSNTDFNNIVNNFKMINYTKKDYDEAVDRVYTMLKKISGFFDKLSSDELNYLGSLLDSPQKLQKKIKLKYKKKNKFL